MLRKLSLGSRRRSSKASKDGSLSENMAKPDMSASPREISGSSLRASGMRSKADRSRRKRESAERVLRAFLTETTMAGNSFCLLVRWTSQESILTAGFTKRKTKTYGIVQGKGQAGNCCKPTILLGPAVGFD